MTSDDLHKIRRKVVDLKAQIFSTKEEVQEVLLCVGLQVVAPAS
ncbi:MAG: hypothetical protein ABSB53_06985 [Nitrososphaerales archaeon]|jgi:hypothetical protein